MARRRSARRPRFYQNPKPAPKSSGMSEGTKIALAVGGLAAVAGIGYLVYRSQQTSTTASSSGGTISSGQQPYQLGPGGSGAALPAAGMSNDGTTIVGSTAYGPGYSADNQPVATNAGELG